VTVDLDAGALGIAGPPGPVAGVARWVCAQLAVLHSPADVALAVLAPGGRAADGLGWLPHLRTAASGPPQLATDPAAAAALARTLVGLAAARTPGPGVPARTDRLVVLLDGSTPPDPETAALWRALLDTDPRAGVRAVCLAAEPRLLPAGCRAVAVVDAAGGLTLQRDEAPPSAPAVAEQVAADRLEPVARSLAPLSDAGPEGAGALPRAVRLASLLGLTDGADRAGAITRRWDAAAADALPAVLGQGPGGPLTVDLVADGPHALVAGTTGAGKSELLQTLVTSLAATHPPEALTFVLLDYKGGAAFSACGRLPHVGGLLTDLDEALAARALRSLHAEVRRRERLLAAVGAADLPALRRLRGADPAAAPGMPRVVLVVDEFAALAEELPDFLGGLVDVARRGRSLGVHLVLATQRPAGVVTAEIRANTALRICLRVTDPADSLDVLDAADAARLAPGLPGRAFVRRGPLAVEPVQVARVSGHTVAQPAGPPRAWRADADEPPSAAAGASAEPATDLALLVDAARAAAARRPATPAAPPWLPPLPVVLPLGELPAGPDDRPAVGLLDLPDEQAQPPLRLDLTRGGGLVVAGGPRSGRTTALRTLALAAARAHPDAVQLYVVDCGGGALAALGRLPHCGAVVDRTDPERIRRLLERLRGEVDRRARLLADGGCADLAEFNAAVPPERRLPALLLLLDRWDVFAGPLAEADLGRGLAAVLGLVADGSAAGLRVVVTGDRTVLSGALGAAVDTRIVLRLPDPADAALAGIDVRSVPRNAHPGRGTYVGPAPGGGRTTVAAVQVAVAADQPSGAAQVAAVHRLADAWRARLAAAPARRRPLRVDPLPQRLTLRAMAGLPTGPGLPLGVGGDELGVLTVQPGGDGPGFTVAGPPRSGRSTALATLAAGLLAQGTPVVVLVPRPSPLRALADRPGVTLLTDPAPSPAEVAALLAGGAAALLVDDADALAYAPVGDVLTAHLLTGPAGPVVVAGSYEGLAGCYRGFCADVRGSGAGLLLAPDGPLASQLLGVAVPRPTAPAPPGRGLLVRGGRAVPVQVAVADEVRDPAGAAARG
jgi:S-DNA-T family DNA segregation ATPase FtsK/SpoIIIE